MLQLYCCYDLQVHRQLMASVYGSDVKLPSNNELNLLQIHRQLMAAVFGSDIKLPRNNELNL